MKTFVEATWGEAEHSWQKLELEQGVEVEGMQHQCGCGKAVAVVWVCVLD
jgi:hypothetical protein